MASMTMRGCERADLQSVGAAEGTQEVPPGWAGRSQGAPPGSAGGPPAGPGASPGGSSGESGGSPGGSARLNPGRGPLGVGTASVSRCISNLKDGRLRRPARRKPGSPAAAHARASCPPRSLRPGFDPGRIPLAGPYRTDGGWEPWVGTSCWTRCRVTPRYWAMSMMFMTEDRSSALGRGHRAECPPGIGTPLARSGSHRGCGGRSAPSPRPTVTVRGGPRLTPGRFRLSRKPPMNERFDVASRRTARLDAVPAASPFDLHTECPTGTPVRHQVANHPWADGPFTSHREVGMLAGG